MKERQVFSIPIFRAGLCAVHRWENLQLEKRLQISYNPVVLARQILKRRSARCSSSLVIRIATPVVTPSGRFSARFAVSAANTIYTVPLLCGTVSLFDRMFTFSKTYNKIRSMNEPVIQVHRFVRFILHAILCVRSTPM